MGAIEVADLGGGDKVVDSKRDALRAKLGPMLDSMQIALAKHHDGDRLALGTIRSLVLAIHNVAEASCLPGVLAAANKARASKGASLPQDAEEVIGSVRSALTAMQPHPVILIVGGPPELSAGMTDLFKTAQCDAVWAENVTDARGILDREDVIFILLNVSLPDAEGKAFLSELRLDSVNASVPLVVVDEKEMRAWLKAADTRDAASEGADWPAGFDAVAAQVRDLLRQSREGVGNRWQDPFTGFLDRDALHDAYAYVMQECRELGDPCSLVYIHLIREDSGGSLTASVWRETTQRLGVLLLKSVRQSDIVGQWNANEFLIILPGTYESGANAAAMNINREIRKEFKTSAKALELEYEASLEETVDIARGLLQPSASQSADIPADTLKVGHTYRTLLFHEPHTAGNLRKLLEAQRHEVTVCGEGEVDFVASLGGKRPHLIVVEEQERGFGIKRLAELRGMPKYMRVPILVLLKPQSVAGVPHVLGLGASDFLVAPFSPMEFLACVKRLTVPTIQEPVHEAEICKILVADENSTALIIAASALHQHGGFEILLARSAQEALERFSNTDLGAVIVDHDMEHRDGQCLLDVILDQADPLRTHIIAAVDVSVTRKEKFKRDLRVKGVVTKPYDALSLPASIQRMLGMKRTRARRPDAATRLGAEIQRVVGNGHAQSRNRKPVCDHEVQWFG